MNQELLALQEQLKQELTAQNTSLPSSSNRVSTKGKVFTMPDGATHDGPLTAIILDWRWQHAFFDGMYNSNKPEPPVCAASSKTEADLKPLPDSKKPQAESCSVCPKNEFGSSKIGNGKACKNTARLAIVPPNPDGSMTPWVLDVPPTALGRLVKYIRDLQGKSLHTMQMITEIDFDPSVDYATLTFKPSKVHEHLAIAFTLREKAQKTL